MLTYRWREDLRALLKSAAHILYHIGVVTLSAGIALSMPFAASFLAQNFLDYWNRIKEEEIVIVSIEIAVALLLILSFNYVGRAIRDRKLAQMATGAGLVGFFPVRGRLTQRRIRKTKEKQGIARNVMVLGATGFGTFVDPTGDLHPVLQDCLEAKVMLMNPYTEAAKARASAIQHPHAPQESIIEQVRQSIDFLKRLKGAHKNVKLKLYSDIPLIKLAILGDYIWMQHYHATLDVQIMPEYLLKHNQNNHGLYTVFYQYFMKTWENPEIPEYDLESDELVYRSQNANEAGRQKFYLGTPAPSAPPSCKGRAAPEEKVQVS
ncbi:MAG: hypothetical protein E6K62_01320 [Nitrospirae bacterium]|nr:MAG: hypothetical protein E6K62_01320 [Nitrospirota bacterium]TLY45558.1 MAG: hypothetical protein E6K59_03775 [Nitrospirota bacterium]